MSVVQRCPNCGTTKGTSGECEACHEAQVRYFCTNHTPGLWLEESKCPSCGARFGDAPAVSVRTGSPAPVPAAIPVRTRSVGARAPASTSAPPPTYSRTSPPRASGEAWGSPTRSPLAHEEELAPSASRMPLWQQILQAAIRARYMPVRAARYRARPSIGREARGCVMRLLFVLVSLFLVFAGAVFLFGRALLEGY
jgi:hypothetical protein